MKLVCASCHRRWTPKKGAPRTNSCPHCRHQRLSTAITRAWDRRKRLGDRTAAFHDTGASVLADLDQLMAEADAAGAKALQAALSITLPERRRS